jgi:hypothetical protein
MATPTIERPLRRPAAELEALFPGRHLSVTSFKRDGTGVATPVWFVSDGERLFALADRSKLSYRLVMLNYRLGRHLRGQQSVADGAALATSVARTLEGVE